MKKILFFLFGLAGFGIFGADAAITVTPGGGGINICGNLAADGSTPAYTTLGRITIAEGLPGDLTNGFPKTLVLDAPAGWSFNTGATPTFAFSAGGNIFSVTSGGMTATTLNVTIFCFGATALDTITITGLQVQANNTTSSAGNITASSAPGMAGVVTGSTNFGGLSLTPVLTPSVTVTPSPTGAICEGTLVTFTANPVNGGTPTFQWRLNGGVIPGATNTVFSSSTLADGDIVRVGMTATGCVSPTIVGSAPLVMTVNAVPVAPVVTGAGTYCDSATLSATPTGPGTLFFQGTTSGGTSTSFPGGSHVVTTPGTNTYYFRTRSAAGCWGPESSVVVTINASPGPVMVAGAGAYCNNATITASVSGGGTIYYQGLLSGGTSTSTPSTSQFITTPGTHTYYFRAVSGACWGPEGSAKVTVNLQPSAISITPATTATFCLGDSATFIASATAPLTEVLEQDFNSGLGAWTITNIATAGQTVSFFQIRNSPGYLSAVAGDGSPYVQAAGDATGSGSIPTNTIITSPSFSLAGYTSASVSFNQYYQAIPGFDVTASVEYSVGGGPWISMVNQAPTSAGSTTWLSTSPDFTIALPGAALGATDVRLRWNYFSNWGWHWAIDNIKVSGTPTLDYAWVGVSGASGLSCATCDTVSITPAMAGTNVYSVSTSASGCTVVAGVSVSVNPIPTIYTVTGGGGYCAGGTGVSVGLSNSEVGIDYQLYNGAAAVGGPVAGTGAALDFGLQTVAGTYSVVAGNTSTLCARDMSGTVDVIVNPLPTVHAVTGGGTFCASDTGAHIGLDGSDTAISYQLYNGTTAVGAPVAGTGFPLDFGLHTASGTYSVLATDDVTACTNNMSDSAVIMVSSLPVVYNVTGGGAYCAGDAGVSIGLDSSDMSVSYQLYNGASVVGSTMAGTGSSIDFGLQTAAGTYTVLATNDTSGCASAMNDSAVIIVNPLPATITGASSVCVGDTTTLMSATSVGFWYSSNPAVATIDTAFGILTGVSAGTVEVTFTGTTGCFVTHAVTVNGLPVVAPISGMLNLCVGDTTTLTNDSTGGFWYSADMSIAMVDTTSGMIGGIAPGITTISYTVINGFGCSTTVTASDTVTALPVVAPITGATDLCVGSSVTLSSATSGGVWSSDDISIGTIDTMGMVTGVDSGSVVISYTVSVYPGCSTSVTASEMVHPLPVIASISGDTSICAGMMTIFTDATSGGTWSSSDTTVATVNASGVVSGIATGVAFISYTVTNSFGCTDFVVHDIAVGSAITSISILPAGTDVTLCHGNPVNLVGTIDMSISYQWSKDGSLIAGATNSNYIATTTGMYTLEVSNGLCTMTLPGKNVVPSPNAMINYNTSGDYLYTGTFPTYLWLKDGAEMPDDTASLLFSPTPGDYQVVVSDGRGCYDTSDVYTILPSGITFPTQAISVKVYPNPASSIINIESPVTVRVVVIAPDGRYVTEKKEATSINVGNLANGMYMLMIYDEQNTLLRAERFSKIN